MRQLIKKHLEGALATGAKKVKQFNKVKTQKVEKIENILDKITQIVDV